MGNVDGPGLCDCPAIDTFYGGQTSWDYLTCTMPLEKMPRDPRSLRVMIDCIPLPEFADSSGNRNWTLDLDQMAVVLEGKACWRLELAPPREIDIVADCP